MRSSGYSAVRAGSLHDASRTAGQIDLPDDDSGKRTLLKDSMYLLVMVLILIFSAFARPSDSSSKLWQMIFSVEWYITSGLLLTLVFMLKA